MIFRVLIEGENAFRLLHLFDARQQGDTFWIEPATAERITKITIQAVDAPAPAPGLPPPSALSLVDQLRAKIVELEEEIESRNRDADES